MRQWFIILFTLGFLTGCLNSAELEEDLLSAKKELRKEQKALKKTRKKMKRLDKALDLSKIQNIELNQKIIELEDAAKTQIDEKLLHKLQEKLADQKAKHNRLKRDKKKFLGDVETAAFNGQYVVIHYWRPDGNYSGWGVDARGLATIAQTTNEDRIKFRDNIAEFGATAIIPVKPNSLNQLLKITFRKGAEYDIPVILDENVKTSGMATPQHRYQILNKKPVAWIVSGVPGIFNDKAAAEKAKQEIQAALVATEPKSAE